MNPPSPRSVDAIIREELDRIARIAVELRAARVWRMLLPMAGVVALAPTVPRALIVSTGFVVIYLLSKRDPERLRRVGASDRLIAENGILLASFHGALFLITGGLTSPALPILFVFTFLVSLLLGPSKWLWVYRAVQMGVVVLLSAGQALGWAAELSPAWLVADLSPTHVAVTGTLMLGLVYGASGLGVKLRAIFGAVLARVAEGRADLLAAHQAQAEELTALSGAIAHELKNPLASVKGLAGLLARDVADGKPAERLSVLRREVDRMQGVLEEFLTFSRPLVPLTEATVELRALVDEVAALHEGLARDQNHHIVVVGAGVARLDPRKTRQVLINLVQNALEASPPGGQVRVEVRTVGDDVELTVDDDGAGPDPDLGARIFEPGVTTKSKGNGLGLTIARTLARQQGGDLLLAARAGGGARATLRLPTEGAP